MKFKTILSAVAMIAVAGSCMKTKLELTYNNQEGQIDKYIEANRYKKMSGKIFERTDTLGFEVDTTFLYDTTYVEEEMIVDTSIVQIDTTWETKEIFRDTTWTDTLNVVRKGGANRLVTKDGTGPDLKSSGYVSFYYAGYTFTGSFNKNNLFTTNHQQTAQDAGWSLTDEEYELYEIHMKDAKLIPGLKDGLVGVQAEEECEILFSGKYGFGDENFGIVNANSALLYKIWVVAVTND